MKKVLTRLTLAALAAVLCARVGAAQTAPAAEWVKVSPAGEDFSALMPGAPVSAAQRVEAGGLGASGRSYVAAGDESATFVVWSLRDTSGAGPVAGAAGEAAGEGVGAASLYLDRIAELAWELVVKPEVERLKTVKPPEGREVNPQMTYRSHFEFRRHPARAYFVALEKTSGAVYVWADGPRIYVVAALAADAQSRQLKQFTDSFALKNMEGPGLPPPFSLIPGLGPARASGDTALPVPAAIQVDPLLMKPDPGDETGTRPPATAQAAPNASNTAPRANAGAGAATAGNDGPFRYTEVTKKALLTFKPEPGFTEQARKFSVTGVVRLRGVLTAAGQVEQLSVVKGLPHGLTERALSAAKRVTFKPAQKDGRPVSQHIIFDYHFNVY